MKMKMVNWPTYSDGTEVKLGDKVMSLRGPMKLLGVEIHSTGWTLRGYLAPDMCADDEEPTQSYIIDEGEYGEWHPTRADQYCDFWPDTEREAVEYYGAEVVAKNTGRTVDEVWMDAANEVCYEYAPYDELDCSGDRDASHA